MIATIQPWLQAVCALLLCLACGAINAQTASMRVALSDEGYLPLDDPYCTTPTSPYLGENPQLTNLCDDIQLSLIPTATSVTDNGRTRRVGVVDWVLVELRETSGNADAAVGSTVIARKPGLLLSNGRVVDAVLYEGLATEARNSCLTGNVGLSSEADSTCPDLAFEGITVNDSLYVVVRHRNHLDIISAVPVTGTDNLYVYDFSRNAGAVRNGVQKESLGQPAIRREVGFAMMISGDVDASNSVLPDTDILRIRTTFGLAFDREGDYVNHDVNLDGRFEQPDDFEDFLRSNLGVYSPVPN